jgi:hypothetical protein
MLVDNLLSARGKSVQSIITMTYPERWKCQDAFLYYFICTPTPFNYGMGPAMGIGSVHSHPTSPENVTYRLTACCMLSSRLSFCAATSMRATTSPESALAVISIRSVHFLPAICIPERRRLAWCTVDLTS